MRLSQPLLKHDVLRVCRSLPILFRLSLLFYKCEQIHFERQSKTFIGFESKVFYLVAPPEMVMVCPRNLYVSDIH